MLHFLAPYLRIGIRLSLIASAAAVVGCAQDRPSGYYESARETTLADAHKQAQGRRGARAPSQVQLGFGERDTIEPSPADEGADDMPQAASTRNVRELLEAKTFLGTVPCLTDDGQCPASRVTLTLAPSGEWRARIELVGASASQEPIVHLGCWDITGRDPLRIALKTRQEASLASFVFSTDNMLRVTMYNGVRPTLDYHLTRQADLDPIDELAGEAALTCN